MLILDKHAKTVTLCEIRPYVCVCVWGHLQLGVEHLQPGAGVLQAERVPALSLQLLPEVLAGILGLAEV